MKTVVENYPNTLLFVSLIIVYEGLNLIWHGAF